MNEVPLFVDALENPADRHERADGMPLLVMSNIVKYYGSQRVLAGVDFSVSRGEIVGLVGANGAGKTTLLKILGGVIAPSSGTITIAGHDISVDKYHPAAATEYGIATVHQELALCTNLAVWENWSLLLDPVWRQRRGFRLTSRSPRTRGPLPGQRYIATWDGLRPLTRTTADG